MKAATRSVSAYSLQSRQQQERLPMRRNRPGERRLVTGILPAALVLGISVQGIVGCAPGDDSAAHGSPSSAGGNFALGAAGPQVEALYQYLRTYGYFSNDDLQRSYPMWRPVVATPPARTDVFDAHMEEAIRAFQLNTGLAQTGIADEATRKRMAQPRCSFPDGVAALDRSNKWDLSNHGSWGKSNLTWKLVNTDGDLSVTAVRNLIQGALSQWSVPSAYSFTEVTGTGSADILITFEAFTANGHPDPDGLASTAFISGGGDVKLMAAVGAWVGLAQGVNVLIVSAIAGGFLAVGYMLIHKQVFETLRNTAELARHHLTSGFEPHPLLNVQQAGTLRLPYGLAVAIGTFYCVGNAFWWR